ncbi:hypothetical protein EVAR_53134_1 [Eumeta japonica]|uniref:Uncharacterized protein n=1 Tax=Eumeta variegata TaxID=151549 RepID=A0A4C1YF96_EUMVA|nr:hypothetical protein EVAR_53134_1 [Eumeta japonica]
MSPIPGGDRTHDLWIRSPTRYPLRHRDRERALSIHNSSHRPHAHCAVARAHVCITQDTINRYVHDSRLAEAVLLVINHFNVSDGVVSDPRSERRRLWAGLPKQRAKLSPIRQRLLHHKVLYPSSLNPKSVAVARSHLIKGNGSIKKLHRITSAID